MKKLYLIDGSNYFYRAFWAIRGLATSKGFPTNAVYGFIYMILKILKTREPDLLAVVFDAPGPTFRDEIYKEYKATRDPMPDDLAKQIPYIKEVPKALNVSTLEIKGVEADDVIATLAARARAENLDVVVVTGDKDLMQLVTKQSDDPEPGVILYDDMKDRFVGIDEVKEKFGVPPERVVDIQALIGDTSDNIPGVKGIGEKSASMLVSKYGGIEDMYARLDAIEPRYRKLLEADREHAFLSKKLATLNQTLEIDARPEEFARREPDRERMVKLCTELEFTRFLKDLDASAPKQKACAAGNYRLIRTKAELQGIVSSIQNSRRLSLRLETDSGSPMRAKIVGMALCARPGEAAYVPVAHHYLGAPAQMELASVLETLRPVFEDPGIDKGGHDIKLAALLLKRHGISLAPIAFDPMLSAYLLNPDAGPFDLLTLCRKHLAHDMIPETDVAGKGRNAITYDQVDVEKARDASGERADIALRLSPTIEASVREIGMGDLYEKIERPLIDVLLEMELHGVKIDVPFLKSLSRDFDTQLRRLLKLIHQDAGEEFNVDSPKQLQRILFEKLGLSPGKKTATGFSTDVSVLEKLGQEHPLPARILEYRGLSKLKGTYIDSLPELVNPDTGRIHTSYHQTVAATGRLSSSDPNLQNIPIRTEEGRKIRRAFVPEGGWAFVSADYSQVELRIVAHLSGEERLIRAFQEGEDIHSATAAEVFGTHDITPELRRRAKAINFGIIYGMSGFGLSQRLGIEASTASEYIDLYFARYSAVKRYIDSLLEEARKKGYVTTMFGRRRYVPKINDRNRMERNAAERVAVNAPIQGTAADLIKVAMIRVLDRFRKAGMKSKLILQVHDELVVEAPENEAEAASRAIQEEMENVHPMKVPLKVDLGRGPNWAELK